MFFFLLLPILIFIPCLYRSRISSESHRYLRVVPAGALLPPPEASLRGPRQHREGPREAEGSGEAWIPAASQDEAQDTQIHGRLARWVQIPVIDVLYQY